MDIEITQEDEPRRVPDAGAELREWLRNSQRNVVVTDSARTERQRLRAIALKNPPLKGFLNL